MYKQGANFGPIFEKTFLNGNGSLDNGYLDNGFPNKH
jgi:hypothetical protein